MCGGAAVVWHRTAATPAGERVAHALCRIEFEPRVVRLRGLYRARVEPSNPAALANLAATLLSLDELEECREVLTTALSIAPEDRVNSAISAQLEAKEAARRPWWRRWL